MDNKYEQHKKNIFERFFSLNEFRTSSLVLALYTCIGLAIFICFDKGDIPQNLTSLLEILVVTIGGANAVGWVSSNLGNRNNNQYSDQYYSNQYPTTNSIPINPIIMND